MLNIARTLLVAAGLFGFAMVAATIAVAQENSNSATQSNAGTPTATNPSNLSKPETAQTEQQSKAPVVDPQAAAVEHSVTTPTSPGQANRSSRHEHAGVAGAAAL